MLLLLPSEQKEKDLPKTMSIVLEQQKARTIKLK
jgi:hypothetical protein